MTLFSGWLASPEPDAAVEIAPSRVAALTLASRGTAATVSAHASEPLPAGAVVSSLTGQNIVDPGAVTSALRRTLERLGTRVSRVALVVPDPVAKVSLVRFDRVPTSRDDLDQLVRWQVRKGAPFPIEEACVTYTPGARSDNGTEFVVAVARRSGIQEYEAVCDAAGVHAGRIDLATLSVVNLCLASDMAPTGDWLLVHMRPEYASLVIMRGDAMIFFRSRGEGDGQDLGDLVHQTAMYYQDRLSGGGFGRVLLAGTGRDANDLELTRFHLEERLGVTVAAVDPTRAASIADRISTTATLDDVLAPMLGVLLRSRREAVPA